MIKTGIILVLVILITNSCGQIILNITQGSLNGTEKVNRHNETFYSFQKIPFAQPPIGDLRFKEPEEAGNWDDILDATQDLPECHQGGDEDTEDCLYLNVYTPQLPSTDEDLLDVMVWIYGGALVENSGREDLYSPEYLLTEDIVLVTINYRLGIFGAFHLEDTSLLYPGNLGLKDQALALKWVQNNIEQFGGNPDSVTIFGESAGGCSVHYHVLSPLSAGTFHKAIIQSGTAISPWAVGLQNNGVLLAEVLNVETNNSTEMINALLDFSGEEIFAGDQLLRETYNVGWQHVAYPIVEVAVEDLNNFITEEPRSIIENGNYNDVPLMVGYTNAEGINFRTTYTSLAGYIPGDLEIEEGSDEETAILDEMQNFYGVNETSSNDTETIIQMTTDVWFAYPAYRLAIEHQKTSNSSIYFYRFSADTLLNVYKLRNEENANFPGATHGDELGYLFHTYYHDNITGDIEEGSVEDLAITRMVTLWTNFARYGNPTPEDFTEFEWLPITSDAFHYAEIGTNETVIAENPDAENLQFWADIYETYYGSNAMSYSSQSFLFILSIFTAYLSIDS